MIHQRSYLVVTSHHRSLTNHHSHVTPPLLQHPAWTSCCCLCSDSLFPIIVGSNEVRDRNGRLVSRIRQIGPASDKHNHFFSCITLLPPSGEYQHLLLCLTRGGVLWWLSWLWLLDWRATCAKCYPRCVSCDTLTIAFKYVRKYIPWIF